MLLGWDKKLLSSKCCWGPCVLVMRAIFRICGNESQSSLQPFQKLATPLSTTKSQFRVKQIRLSSIISNVTNNKHELWKPVRLIRFRKPQFPIRFNLFSCLFLYLLCSFYLFFHVFSYHFYVLLSLLPVTTVWTLIKLEIQFL